MEGSHHSVIPLIQWLLLLLGFQLHRVPDAEPKPDVKTEPPTSIHGNLQLCTRVPAVLLLSVFFICIFVFI